MEYFIIENGQQAGPFSIEQLIQKRISAETLVWAQGMADWTPAWKIEELRTALDQIQNLPPIPPTITPQMPVEEATMGAKAQPQEPEQQPKKKSSKTLWKVLLGLVVFILLIFAFTNPGEDAHKQTVTTEVNKAMEQATNMPSDNFFTQGFRAIAKMMAGNFMNTALDELFEYHNYVFFSKGTVSFGGKNHTVSFGILGKVYTMNADDMIKALEKDNNLIIKESSSSTSSDNDALDDADNADSSEDATEGTMGKKLEDKANQTVDKITDKVSKKVEEKINQKLDEVTDSSTIEKIIDKVLSLF